MTTPSASQALPVPAPSQRTFLGHPVGLYVLFLTEMWERFNYYGMRALLMLYMVNYFRWEQEHASTIYKWYTSLVYLTPLLGGYLADRFLGNKWAVIIGAAVMAVGEMLLAFEPSRFSLGIDVTLLFFTGLVLMILGNGFFKPNMSTQVGRLYPQGDPRRDGAYTIFYMGINLGAFLAPFFCTPADYHRGFAVAGGGMIVSLLIYVFGLRWVHELPQGQSEPPKELPAGTMRPPLADHEGTPEGVEDLRRIETPVAAPRPALSEEEAARTPSVTPGLTEYLPTVLGGIGVLLALAGVALLLLKLTAWDNVVSLEVAAGAILFTAWIVSQVRWALRDRVLAILLMGVPVVAYWAAGEQAGNALNIWADKTTNRYLLHEAPRPPVYTGAEGNIDWLDPVPTTWFQSINPLAIFVLAPPFAFLWTWLARRGLNPSIATKMALGVLLMALAMGLMTWSAQRENGATTVSYTGSIPDGVYVNDQHQLCRKEDDHLVPFHQGRLTYDAQQHQFHMNGVLSDLARDDIVGRTAPKSYVEALKHLQEQSKAGKGNASLKLNPVPPGFNPDYSGLGPAKVTFDRKQGLLEAHNYTLEDKDLKALRVAGGEPTFREAMDQLYLDSSRYRVSSWWLFWFYVLATVGELCLSPIGLSMVSKLAPARFATMLMGLWMLTSFFGNFIAGALGEQAEHTPPITYFLQITIVLAVLSLVVFVLARLVTRLMHGVE